VSGLTEFSALARGHAYGPLWLTGGSYGIEASAVGTVAIALGLVLLVVFVRPRTVPMISELCAPEVYGPKEVSAPAADPMVGTPPGKEETGDSPQSSQPLLPPNPQEPAGTG
jgi:hypothetical protein